MNYSSIFENIPLGIHIYNLEEINDDRTLRMVFINQYAADITGVPIEDTIGKTLDENFPGLRERGIPQAYAEVVRTGKSKIWGEVYYTDNSVSHGVYSVKAFPLPDNHVGVSFENITERVRAENELIGSKTQLQSLFDNMINGFAYHQLVTGEKGEPIDYIFLEVNKAFENLTGLKRNDIIGKKVTQVYPEIKDMAFDWIRTYGKVALTREPAVFEQFFEPENHWYLISAYSPEKGHFALTFEDITERKAAEELLLKNKDQMTLLVDNLIDSIFVTDQKGTVEFVNDAACKLFGRQKKELLGIDFGFPVMLDEIFEITTHLSDGKIRYAEAKSNMIEWQGQPSYLISLRDITERKQAMEEHERMNKYIQQVDKIESIGNLAGGIAHDFNNMLSVIIGYGEELTDTLHPTDPLHDAAKEILDAGRRSAALTRQLLAFSRRQALQPEVLDLNYNIENIQKMIRRIIGEDIALTIFPGDDLANVEVDPGQIEQVIVNLAVNARDAMPGGGKLTFETANVELDEHYASVHVGVTPGEYVMLSVTDSGHGMDQKTRDRIFEPFFTTKESGKGTGLGLSTVYGIVKQSRGNIWVYSEPGQGTTFKIYLPVTTDEFSVIREIKHDNATVGNGENILLVEDEPSLRKYCQKILKNLNYNVTVAANGGEALLLVEEKKIRPDLIVTDMVMPVMNGKTLVDRLKKQLPNLNVLYMSGYSDNTIVHHGHLDASTPYIQKPFTKEKLGRTLRSLLEPD